MGFLGQWARENSLIHISGKSHSTVSTMTFLLNFPWLGLENKDTHSILSSISMYRMMSFSLAYLIDGSTSHQVEFITSPTSDLGSMVSMTRPVNP
jgi:hypothetical protein